MGTPQDVLRAIATVVGAVVRVTEIGVDVVPELVHGWG